LPEQDFPLYRFLASRAAHRRFRLKVIQKLAHFPGSPFFRIKRLKVIVRDIDSDGLYVTNYSLGVALRKLEEQLALVRTKLEVGFLDKIIRNLIRSFSPLTSGTNDRKPNWQMKSGHKFVPCGTVI
jgi:hypothetical protein